MIIIHIIMIIVHHKANNHDIASILYSHFADHINFCGLKECHIILDYHMHIAREPVH